MFSLNLFKIHLTFKTKITMYCEFIMYIDAIHIIIVTAGGGVTGPISLQNFYISHKVVQYYL